MEKSDFFEGRPEILGAYCKRLFPVLLSKIIRSHPGKKYNAAKIFFHFKKFLFKYEHRGENIKCMELKLDGQRTQDQPPAGILNLWYL
jgi:hypothetical protein